ncbi:MAG: hypothetical protein KG075_09575 [Alphaproteobacteria bacterium]|nr:hypothetical protein [Alphaproteobacteria bacterium]
MLAVNQFAGFGAGGKKYVANAAKFDGTNDYLRRTIDWTGGALSSKVGILSAWINLKGGDGSLMNINLQDGGFLGFTRTAANKYRVAFYDTGGGTISLDLLSNSTYLNGSGWKHILASWDVAAAAAHLYVNDVSDLAGSPTIINNTLEYGREVFSFGADQAGGSKLNADVSDFYFNTDTYLDFSSSANRRKFISGSGKPVFLGLDGSVPTGAKPQICLTNAFATWHQNVTGYGDFTVTGALAAGSNSPSD